MARCRTDRPLDGNPEGESFIIHISTKLLTFPGRQVYDVIQDLNVPIYDMLHGRFARDWHIIDMLVTVRQEAARNTKNTIIAMGGDIPAMPALPSNGPAMPSKKGKVSPIVNRNALKEVQPAPSRPKPRKKAGPEPPATIPEEVDESSVAKKTSRAAPAPNGTCLHGNSFMAYPIA